MKSMFQKERYETLQPDYLDSQKELELKPSIDVEYQDFEASFEALPDDTKNGYLSFFAPL